MAGSDHTTGTRPSAQSGDEATLVEGKGAMQGGTLPLSNPSPVSAVPDSQDLRLLEVIGRGGMGRIFRGEQLGLRRSVAFKQLLDTANDTLRERFVREAQITAQLDHPNIVPVHTLEVSAHGGVVGYAMKLVEGKTLRALMTEAAEACERGDKLDHDHSLATRLDHFLKICDALSFAHARGILHRDLKPANMMIGKFGEVYVMDWGVARPMGSPEERVESSPSRGTYHPDLTQLGEIVGSPSYMSPEQAEGRNDELDARSDQYGLGLILFELVSLRRAVDGSSLEEVFTRAVKGEKAPLVHVSKRERIPTELRAIIHKATAFEPGDRYPSVGHLAEDVRRYLRGEAVVARPDNLLEGLLRWMSRHRRATLALVLAVLAASAIAVGWTSYQRTLSELNARRRGERLTALYADATAQARRIDAQFQRMEAGLEGLRTAAEWALSGPEPVGPTPRTFLDTDFADAARRPKDFTDQTRYRWPVSMESPVIGIAPGTDRQQVGARLRRLSVLRDHMADMFIVAGGEDPQRLSAEEKRRYLFDRKSPIDYAYVALPDGIHYMLPGMDSLPPGYDVRTAGFYTMSANKHGRRWGAPYVDSTTDEQGDDLVLPCTQGLWSPSGQFLGVAGVEITVTKIVETGLTLPGHTTRRTSLVNGEGKKVIDSGDAGKRFKASGKDEGLVLSEFDIPQIAQAARDGAQGLREIEHQGKPLIVILVRLDVLGWFYVVEMDPAQVGG